MPAAWSDEGPVDLDVVVSVNGDGDAAVGDGLRLSPVISQFRVMTQFRGARVVLPILFVTVFLDLVGFGITIPDWLSTDYRTAAKIPGLFENAPHLFGVPIVFNILAFGIVALITIVLVIGNSCSACHVKIRPAALQALKAGRELTYCDSCKRILYWDMQRS